MPQSSPILSMPYIQPAQAQKHVTHNEALRILDAVTQLSVISTDIGTPPVAPTPGDRYIVASPAGEDWEGQEQTIAIWVDNTWQFFAASVGWRADIAGTGDVVRFDGTAWQSADAPVLQNVPVVGIGTTADATNKLSVSAEATLFNHAGNGHQVKLNKNTGGDTNSVLFQTGYSGRAEMGTAGSDDFAIKVSADGSSFNTALSIDAGTGAVQFPTGQSFFEDVYIADDAAWSVDIPWADPARILMWMGVDLAATSYLFSITGALAGAGNFAEISASPAASLGFATGILTGTTGTDGEVTVAIDTSGAVPKLYVENRLGTGQQFTLSTLGK